MKTGGGENGQRMRYGAQGSDSMAGEARVALGGGGSRRRGCSPTSVWKEEEEAGWAEWVEKAKQAGWRLGQNLKRISFPNKKIGLLNIPNLWKFVQGDLGGNFDVRIFPKFL
jgi:hypothetical protein